MTYQTVAGFAQTWGLGFFFLMFLVVLVYALWPKNRDRFERAAHAPLRNDDYPES
ncbi:MAG: cbb3-type cytochrome c oxidase subunit 3 [Alphaproteobacteria bacterium]|nr:cbb3-type cytochrome c oxidase subunit 3 [Alphaproteobacteria bacterium]MDX5369776.1 cbb3-type cytochrome c oxidase subunit 3 [Alphaproteobacteria bacterium]MDX5464400.1 cbb3-type cytochrome c oxidase subunit 3 [Alphaproteobacteria bacterium]